MMPTEQNVKQSGAERSVFGKSWPVLPLQVLLWLLRMHGASQDPHDMRPRRIKQDGRFTSRPAEG